VAGLEPENTNVFLAALASAAADGSMDSNAAVQRCLNGEQAGTGPPALKGGGGGGSRGAPAEAKSQPMEELAGSKGSPSPAKGGDDEERGKSRGGTRGGKPARQSTDVGLGGVIPQINLDGEVEKCDGSVELTQSLLGGVIQKPKLAEKLLNKPPFRFLYDIIMEVRRVTNFAAGLYTPAEDDVAQIADKSAKIQYLEKIIRLVGVQLNTIVEARPAKIVAGLDAQLTNVFLQLLAVCAVHNPNSATGVRSVLDQMGVEGGDIPAAGGGGRDGRQEDKAAAEPKHSQGDTRQEPAPAKSLDGERREIGAKTSEEGGGEDGDAKRSGRPTTARRRPPKVKEGAKEVEKHASPVRKAEGIMADGAGDDEVDDDIADESDRRLADDVRADGKAGSQADPESKLVRDILGRQAEQEAARNPQSNRREEDTKASDDAAPAGGIRLGRLRKTGMEKKGSNTDLPQLGEGDLERLRQSIQTLVQHTGPLGGCLDYLQEDVGLMTTELRKWEDECRKFEGRVEKERAKSVEVLYPLTAQLTELEAQIAERVSRISSAKANIARNEDRLLQLLRLVSTS